MIGWLGDHAFVIVAVLLPPALACLAAVTVGRRWLREPLLLLRWHALISVYVLGCLGSAGIIGAAVAVQNAKTVGREARASDKAQLRREIAREARQAKRDRLTAAQIRRIARRTASLETPTTTQIIEAIQKAANACRKRPAACRRAAESFRVGLNGAGGGPLQPPTGASTPTRRQDGPTATSPPRRPGGGGGGSSPPAPGPARPPAGPGRPPAAVDGHLPEVTTPPVGPVGPITLPKVPVCAPPLITLDCPPG